VVKAAKLSGGGSGEEVQAPKWTRSIRDENEFGAF